MSSFLQPVPTGPIFQNFAIKNQNGHLGFHFEPIETVIRFDPINYIMQASKELSCLAKKGLKVM
jgi:hypothetical protein